MRVDKPTLRGNQGGIGYGFAMAWLGGGRPGSRVLGGLLDQTAHLAARTETWALRLRAHVDGEPAPRPMSEEAAALTEMYPEVYTLGAPRLGAIPDDRREKVRRAVEAIDA